MDEQELGLKGTGTEVGLKGPGGGNKLGLKGPGIEIELKGPGLGGPTALLPKCSGGLGTKPLPSAGMVTFDGQSEVFFGVAAEFLESWGGVIGGAELPLPESMKFDFGV